MSFELSPELKKRSIELNQKTESLISDWVKDSLNEISQDNSIAIEIIDFLIDVLKYAELKKSNPKSVLGWLNDLAFSYYYGQNADDFNYLDFDEVSVYSIIVTHVDKPTLKNITDIKTKLEAAKKKFK